MTAFSSVEYDSQSRRSPVVTELLEIVRYKSLVRLMIISSIKTRYKRSALGVVWTLIAPLLNMAVLTFAFSTILRTSIPNYPVYVLSGLILWTFFAQTTVYAMHSLVWGGSLLKRVYIPRTLFAVVAVGNGLVNLFLALIPLAIIMLATGQPFYPSLVYLPFSILIAAMFVLGVSLFLSTLAVYFTDVVEMYQVLVQAWFFLTPIIYPNTILAGQFIWLMNLNPMYNLLELFRWPIYLGYMPGPKTVTAAAASAVVALIVGWWAFARKADELAYRL